jgi:hypothetical protein
MTLLFDEDSHTYTLAGTGGSYTIPSVSQVLKKAGLYDYPQNEAATVRMNYGTHIHKLTHLFDQKVLAPSEVLGKDRAYLESYERFVKEAGFIPQINEQRYHHRLYLYAGTIDKVGTIMHPDYAGRFQVEVKTGAPHPANRVQVAAYHRMLEDNGEKLDGSILLYLSEASYRMFEVSPLDCEFDVFLSALTLNRWKEAHKIGQRT